MSESRISGRVIGLDYEKRPAKKRLLSYTKTTFQMYDVWIREFFMIHHSIYAYIGDSLENFYKILDEKFFEWLNQPKNYSKFMFEIKNKFMDMADEVLLFEIMVKKLKNPILIDLNDIYYSLVPEERYIPQENIGESEYDYEIDYFSDPEPSYNLMEECHVLDPEQSYNLMEECHVPDIESSTYDDNYYSSFFI
jgi:hypothetical protein